MTQDVKSYRDLKIWRKGINLAGIIYAETRNFPQEELYGLTSQMRRAAVSVPSNIAEGQARRHTKEFRQFLYQALGSLAELDTQIEIALGQGFLGKESSTKLFALTCELQKMVYSLISRLPAAH